MSNETDNYPYIVYTDKPNQIYDDENIDLGWEVSRTQIFSETVPTVLGDLGNTAALAYDGDPTTLGTLAITLNDTSYTCEQQTNNGQYWWGAPSPLDFSEYPFIVLAASGTWQLITETAGEYTVTASESIATTSPDFDMATQAAVGGMAPLRIVPGKTTWQEVYNAMSAGRVAVAPVLGTNVCSFIALYAETSTYSVYCVACTDPPNVSMVTLTAASADGVLEPGE